MQSAGPIRMFLGVVQAVGTWHACLSTSAWSRLRRSHPEIGGLSDSHLVRGSGLVFACHGGGPQQKRHDSRYRERATLGPEAPGEETRNTTDPDLVPAVPVRPLDLVPDLFHVRGLHTRYCYSPAKDS